MSQKRNSRRALLNCKSPVVDEKNALSGLCDALGHYIGIHCYQTLLFAHPIIPYASFTTIRKRLKPAATFEEHVAVNKFYSIK